MRKIVLIEDNKIFRNTIQILLKNIFEDKLIIQNFSDFESARVYLDNEDYDLIISDLNFPDSSESETLEYFQNNILEKKKIIISGSIRDLAEYIPNTEILDKDDKFNESFKTALLNIIPSHSPK